MSKERHYMEECRAKVIAEIGQMEAQGFNMRALKTYITDVDNQQSGVSVLDETVEKKETDVGGVVGLGS